MRAQVDCYPCVLSQFVALIKRAAPDADGQQEILKKFLRLMLEADKAVSPPEIAAMFHAFLAELTEVSDPMREIKERSTELALALLPELRRLVQEASDPFEASVRLAIGGNIIDYGVNPNFDLDEAGAKIREVMTLPFDRELCTELKRRLDAAKSVFYLLDNCGEAVIDRLIIEPYRGKITVGVRGFPIFNDVTRREAALSGITDVPIVDTGDCTPGVPLRRTSREFLEAMRRADVVVSKGQGNFETLDEEFTERPIFFLLRVKCQVVARRTASAPGAIRIIGKNL